MNNVFLILGGNLGEREKNLAKALEKIVGAGAVIKHISSVYETEPWGVAGQPNYYNMVVEILTSLDAEPLMRTILNIEEDMGRVRTEKYNARTIDIDILLFNDEVIDSETVQIPHPRMQERRFVLEPLSEIAPDLIHPSLHKSINALLEACTDPNKVKKI